ncbi:hypothetical protein TNCV_4309541 [Trichonephila clavipes]|nr:hypothetical protein TNCV_4309541 [Trichonephila clavipes]
MHVWLSGPQRCRLDVDVWRSDVTVSWYSERNDDYWILQGVPSMPRENYLIRMYKLTTGNMADFIKNMTKKDGGVIRLVG